MEERLMEVECELKCPHCGGIPFVLYRRRHRKRDGTLEEAWENILWPRGKDVLPPNDPHHIACPDCGIDCVRTR